MCARCLLLKNNNSKLFYCFIYCAFLVTTPPGGKILEFCSPLTTPLVFSGILHFWEAVPSLLTTANSYRWSASLLKSHLRPCPTCGNEFHKLMMPCGEKCFLVRRSAWLLNKLVFLLRKTVFSMLVPGGAKTWTGFEERAIQTQSTILMWLMEKPLKAQS